MMIMGTFHKTQTCPDDWINLGSYGCYKFLNDVHVESWFEALVSCRLAGGVLANLRNRVSRTALSQVAHSYHKYDFYIGIYRSGRTSDWRWIDDMSSASSFYSSVTSYYDGTEECKHCAVFRFQGCDYTIKEIGCFNGSSLAAIPLCEYVEYPHGYTTIETTKGTAIEHTTIGYEKTKQKTTDMTKSNTKERITSKESTTKTTKKEITTEYITTEKNTKSTKNPKPSYQDFTTTNTTKKETTTEYITTEKITKSTTNPNSNSKGFTTTNNTKEETTTEYITTEKIPKSTTNPNPTYENEYIATSNTTGKTTKCKTTTEYKTGENSTKPTIKPNLTNKYITTDKAKGQTTKYKTTTEYGRTKKNPNSATGYGYGPSPIYTDDCSLKREVPDLEASYNLSIALGLRWVRYGTGDYHTAPKATKWVVAERFCRMIGGRLPIVRSKADLDEIVLAKRGELGQEVIYLGGNDIECEGKWVWNNDGSEIDQETLGSIQFYQDPNKNCLGYQDGEHQGLMAVQCKAKTRFLCIHQ